jgi:Domain of unknown function (DUF4337)
MMAALVVVFIWHDAVKFEKSSPPYRISTRTTTAVQRYEIGIETNFKGPHDELLEEVGEDHGERKDNFSRKIAVMTAILATIGALFSYQVGSTQNEASMDKNNAAIKKTEAVDQWNYYQAVSNKQDIAQLTLPLPGMDRNKFRAEIERYEVEKEAIRKNAEKIEVQSLAWDKASEAITHRHHRWAQAMAALQMAIALAAIALLTRKKWLFWSSCMTATGGILLGLVASGTV